MKQDVNPLSQASSLFLLFALAASLGLGFVARPAWSAATNLTANQPLRVAIKPIAPFVLPDVDPPAGFSIDLWTEVARRMRVDFQWRLVPTLPELLQAVRTGDADVAIAAITMTPEREQFLDFSHPYFDSGLRILVSASEKSPLIASVESFPWLALGELFGIAVILILVLANILVFIERRHGNRSFEKSYLRALGEGIWGIMLIFSTGEHGDREGSRVWKRVAVASMWLLGVVLVAQLTATVTSTQTVQRLQSGIQDENDLPGKTIASVAGTVAGDYLTQRGLPFVAITDGADAIRLLAQGDVKAVVFDAPTLQYWAATLGNGAVRVVGPIFRPQKYGIAVREGSALRKSINEALLEIYDDGTYEKLYAKWFPKGK
jgi:ABC-type amino acid transport substrate-binding protein